MEATLEKLKEEADNFPERHCQLAAVRYYLQYMLWECERHWAPDGRAISNHLGLIDQIERHREPAASVCLVTFNYDRLIEGALAGYRAMIRTMADYVASDRPYKLIKLHGSIDWVRNTTPQIPIEGRSIWEITEELIARAGELSEFGEFHRISDHPPVLAGGAAGLPALAVPTERKFSFQCPPEHLSLLESELPRVSRLLIVGWRGAEHHFLDMLKRSVKTELRVQIVAGNRDAGEDVARKLADAGLLGHSEVFDGGFSSFVASNAVEALLV